jgi:hypothetical protein
MKYFSEDGKYINAECDNCGRVFKIPRTSCIENENGFKLLTSIKCIGCGDVSYVVSGKKLQIPIITSNDHQQSNLKHNNISGGVIIGFVVLCMLLWFVSSLGSRSSFSSNSSPSSSSNSSSGSSSSLLGSSSEPSSGSSSSSSNSNTSWFSGGTLHNSKISEWRTASYSNRLATAADFIAATQKVDYGNLSNFKQMATNLETCISKSAEGGAADDEKTTTISSYCLVMLYPK